MVISCILSRPLRCCIIFFKSYLGAVGDFRSVSSNLDRYLEIISMCECLHYVKKHWHILSIFQFGYPSYLQMRRGYKELHVFHRLLVKLMLSVYLSKAQRREYFSSQIKFETLQQGDLVFRINSCLHDKANCIVRSDYNQ